MRRPASGEENPNPKDLRPEKQETEKRVVETTKSPSKPSKPTLLQLRLIDESSTETTAFIGLRERELLLLTPTPSMSSSYTVWDLSNSELALASSWATLPNRYAHQRP
jgi:hypothetical protein